MMTVKAKYIISLMLLLVVSFAPAITTAQQSPFLPNREYQVGIRAILLKDENRDNRTLQTFIWYPALVPKDAKPPYLPDAHLPPIR